MRISGPTLSQQDQMSVYDVAALTLGELANLINDIRVEFEQVQAAAAEAEARLASQQVELTDWILVADSVKHDWRCDHGERGGPVCLRCRLELAEARLASQGEQSDALLTSWAECRARLREALTARDEAERRIASLEKIGEQAVNLLLGFNENTQELWCRTCKHRPIYDGDTRLHADTCPVYEIQTILAGLQPTDPDLQRPADPPKERI